MHIGIDARTLVGPRTGIGRYLLEMTRRLAELDIRMTFYWPEPRTHDGFGSYGHRESFFRGGLGRLAWSHTLLPWQVLNDRPDMFWGPAHRLPPYLRGHIPAVVTIHDLVWYHFPGTMRHKGWIADRLLMRTAITRAERVVAVSQTTADDLREVLGVASDKIRVIYPGVTDLPLATGSSVRERFGIDAPYVLCVGSREPRKNLDGVIRAFSHMRHNGGPSAWLVIAGGDGWRQKAIREALADSPVSERIRIIGYVNDQDLATLYAGARLLAMPSHYEGFGLPVLEAQRYGVPVLISDRGALPEAAGAGGLRVDPTDIRGIAQALRVLLEDDNLHNRLSAEATRNAARFSWGDSARQLFSLFQEIVGEAY